ncbi:FAD binding domain-containing protein [Streptomyces sp. NPDC093676]|uniref:FAD binding domain-containing protein n=1 Tax=Streptomyces sp. NPDC093676 TaxID=3366050 RepID=UPI00381A6BED
MLLRLPTSLPEAQECMAQGAVPVGGATLVWATWQRDGFPQQAMSLRNLPQANAIEATALGSAVVLHQIDERVPEALRQAAASVGTGAVRRTATVGGNIVGSTLRCLLPAALVLDARAVTLGADAVHETDLDEVVAKRLLLLGLKWRTPIASSFHKQSGEAGGPPPMVVATAVHADSESGRLLRVAVRDGYEVFSGSTAHTADAEQTLHTLEGADMSALRPPVREAVGRQVTDILARTDDH